jgi:hypothetical protein
VSPSQTVIAQVDVRSGGRGLLLGVPTQSRCWKAADAHTANISVSRIHLRRRDDEHRSASTAGLKRSIEEKAPPPLSPRLRNRRLGQTLGLVTKSLLVSVILSEVSTEPIPRRPSGKSTSGAGVSALAIMVIFIPSSITSSYHNQARLHHQCPPPIHRAPDLVVDDGRR